MNVRRYAIAAFLAVSIAFSGSALADDHGKGHGRGHEKHDEDRGYDRDRYYGDRESHAAHEWYASHHDHLPPGLAKRDRLPPGLERQLVRRGTLPSGWQRRMYACPPELERRLPPPPPNCAHVLIGANLVLVNRKTNVVVDIFAF